MPVIANIVFLRGALKSMLAAEKEEAAHWLCKSCGRQLICEHQIS